MLHIDHPVGGHAREWDTDRRTAKCLRHRKMQELHLSGSALTLMNYSLGEFTIHTETELL